MAVYSACSNRLPNLKFVGYTLSASALISLVTLTFDLVTSNLVRVIARRVGNLPTNFSVSILDIWANNCQTNHVTLRP